MDIPTAARVSSALEASDVLADMLADAEGPLLASVPLELVLATTVRALRAGAEVLDGLVSRCSLSSCSCSRSCSSCSLSRSLGPGLRPPAHGPGTTSAPASSSSSSAAATPRLSSASATASTPHANPNSNTSVRDPVTILDALKASSHRLLSTVLPALRAHYAAAAATGNGKGKGKSRLRPSPNHAQSQCAAARAIDDVLGGAYALLLAPLVRAFCPVSTGFVSACLCSSPSLGSSSITNGSKSTGTRTGTDSRGSAKPPPSRTRPGSVGATVRQTTDLRPALLAFLDDTLSVLEDVLVLPGAGPGSGSCSAAREPSAFSPAPKDTSAEPPIPGAAHVKTLLALECVRELERMYVPLRTTSLTWGAAPHHTRVRDLGDSHGHSDGAGAGAGTGTGARTHAPHQLSGSHPPFLRGSQIPGLAQVLCQTLGDESARLGTGAGAGRARGNVFPSLARDASWSSGAPAPAPASASAQENPCASLGARGMRGAGTENGDMDGNGNGNGNGDGNFGETVLGVSSGPARANGGETPRSHGPAHHTDTLCQAGAEAAHCACDCACDCDCDCDDDELRKRARMTRLASKDAAWYLCAVLHRVLPAVGSASRARGSGSDLGSATGFGSATATATATASVLGSRAFPGAASELGVDTDTVMRPPGLALQAHAREHGQGTTEPENTGTGTGTSTGTVTETAAEQAVYDALADLLRRTWTPRLPGRFTGPPSQIRTRTRTRTRPGEEDGPGSGASNHGSGSPMMTTTTTTTAAGAGAAAGAAAREARGVGQDRPLGELGEGRRERMGGHAGAEGMATSASMGMAAGPSPMGEVERGMLLAVLERAWLGI